MNRLGRYDVDAAFDRMSLQTVDEFGLDAILEQLVRSAPLRLKWTMESRCEVLTDCLSP